MGRLAIERGPVVYCAEEADNQVSVFSVSIDQEMMLETEFQEDLLGEVTVLSGQAMKIDGCGNDYPSTLEMIPYFSWRNRGQMKWPSGYSGNQGKLYNTQ